MTISQAERLMETDPARAAELLAAAKQDSKEALHEIRSLVRGIRPPVLADRGLNEALRALAAQSPIATDVESNLRRELSPPLESALYFGISELVTNAVKHSEAERITIRVVDGPDKVRVTIGDNGRGGAEEAAGGGLAGVRRRLEPFDGSLGITSPTGGPTTAVIAVPTA
ncbi:ATP-binding protein [Ammonicoccus fulvus]|uniref:histidine kinase n=1 Tax=Ammonicoccus fulvus TaxID=3138240 RepID=A0ABZ3FIX4_9ACTN